MLKIAIAGLVLAASGLASSSATAAPFSTGSAISVAPAAENVRVVCRERTVWRRNKWGEARRVTIRDCDRVGRYRYDHPRYAEPRRGRYYHNGYYYADPQFTIRIR
jgi:hypothetical protein